jgi:dolichyl-phosphate beta-glucosyltransferase
LLKVPTFEMPVNWHDVEGSKLNIVEDSIKMARDFLVVRLLYLFGLWKYSDDIGY